MALGIFTIRPKSPEDIEDHIRIYRPGRPISAKGDSLAENIIVSPRRQLLNTHLANYVLSKNIKGSDGSWMREHIGQVYGMGYSRKIAEVIAPGSFLWPVDPFPRSVEVSGFEEQYNEKQFCVAAIAKAAYESVNGLPDARDTQAFQEALETRKDIINFLDHMQRRAFPDL